LNRYRLLRLRFDGERTVLAEIWELAISGGVPQRSLIVAVVVGTLLNLINQGDALLTAMPLNWTKLLLTYVVPYCVATYGAVSVQRSQRTD
jgi:hypothetical protein